MTRSRRRALNDFFEPIYIDTHPSTPIDIPLKRTVYGSCRPSSLKDESPLMVFEMDPLCPELPSNPDPSSDGMDSFLYTFPNVSTHQAYNGQLTTGTPNLSSSSTSPASSVEYDGCKIDRWPSWPRKKRSGDLRQPLSSSNAATVFRSSAVTKVRGFTPLVREQNEASRSTTPLSTLGKSKSSSSTHLSAPLKSENMDRSFKKAISTVKERTRRRRPHIISFGARA